MDKDIEHSHEENHGATVGIVIIVLFLIVGAIGMFVKKQDTADTPSAEDEVIVDTENTIPQS